MVREHRNLSLPCVTWGHVLQLDDFNVGVERGPRKEKKKKKQEGENGLNGICFLGLHEECGLSTTNVLFCLKTKFKLF